KMIYAIFDPASERKAQRPPLRQPVLPVLPRFAGLRLRHNTSSPADQPPTWSGWDPLIGSIGCESSDAPEWVQEETITPCHDVGIPLSRSFASCVRASGCSVSSSVLRMCVSTS